MATIQLTIPHYVFLLTVLSIFIAIGFRRGVIIPALVGTFLIGMLSADAEVALLDQVVFGVQVLFNALLNAGAELFGIMAVIALMVSMLHALRAQGADQIMVAPMKKLMGSPMAAFFVLAATMYTAAAFFWPTPAVALVGTVLVPVAMRVGLPALAAAVAINLAGHGMALSADPIIQGATRLTAGAAGIDSQELLPYTVLFSLVTGITAISISVYTIRRDMKSGVLKAATAEEIEAMSEVEGHHDRDDASRGEVTPGKYARALAIGVPITLGCIAGLMIYRGIFNPDMAIRGGDATALLGGAATVLLVLATFAKHGGKALEGITDYLRSGFFFSIKIFAPIIPIAGFFFLGNPDHAAAVIGDGTPGYLFDVGNYIGKHLAGNNFAIGFGMTIIGMLTGMDGSGFSGLPLAGALAGALGTGTGVNVAVLAALGQVAAIFTGGGTLVAWAFGACADAGVSGINPSDLVRRNFIPVMTGLTLITFLAIYLM
tara:strand:- start:12648 stop:14111 length:1464 start_codon:yes stop_codon:yes gene_type:complete